ncbi:Poly A polymerase regulatory subunit [Nannochloropsis gaditana]|uniref:Cap-specific mRNA (nucleoside-2'-O-)-methyltransferase n=1 Tax=Nannochloropsis gaditana TaxID=72520 RepID=W7T3T9_9STRA|nr:Poly A polymerase regulatory subunit [Nannochloropsis gaditana]
MTSNTVGSKKNAALASASGATWIEDEKSWSDYQGLSVLKRMDMIKSVLKEGISQSRDEATAGDYVMGNTMKYLQEVLPADLRTSLPWSALVNLINTGLAKVGWSITGAHESEAPERGKTGKDCEAALTEALQGVTHWLPDAALNHTATPTTTQTVHGPVKSWQDYRAMWPVHYPDEDILRVLSPTFPRRPYRSRQDEEGGEEGKEGGREGEASPPSMTRDPHWGQRKLFLNELELLTRYAEEGDLVLYAGAAPGWHLELLSRRFFPGVAFVLVDPAPFRIEASERVKLVAGLMTDALAREYAGRENLIFISDIRRTYASEDLILEDMREQERWHEMMGPKVSMMKFRLPWRAGETEYLDGEVWTQPYAKARSTETRLVVEGPRKGGGQEGEEGGTTKEGDGGGGEGRSEGGDVG